MAVPTNHYKLGLFVLIGIAAVLLVAILLGATRMRKETIRYHSYFNESVQGLDIGSPVKFRGVTIGHVSTIEIAPDHRMVDVGSELDTAEITRMGLNEAGRKRGAERFAIPPDLRAQLNSQGVTGVKFIAIDFFDVKNNPPPQLTFKAAPNHYIPVASSMMKNLENTVTQAMDRFPELVDAVVLIMRRIDGLLATLEKQDISTRVVTTLNHVDAMMLTMGTTIMHIDEQDLGTKASLTITGLTTALDKLNAVLDELGGKKGLLASAQHATDVFGELGRAGRYTQKELDATLRNVSEAAESIRTLADSLNREPDMLLKGKAKQRAIQ